MKLNQFRINEGGRFSVNGTGPIVIDFSKSKMVGATGDQEMGKTSILDLFLMACGQLGGEKVVEALKNRESEKIDLDLEFTGNDRAKYEVHVTKSTITIKRDGEKHQVPPKEFLKQMLGAVGVSPMDIKNADVDDIVKWLASYSTRSAEEFLKDMNKIKDGIKKARKERAEANKDAKGVRQYLVLEGVATDTGDIIEKVWTEREKKFAEPVDLSKLSTELDVAAKNSDKYLRGEEKVKNLKLALPDLEDEVADLEKQLEEARSRVAETKTAIEAAEKFLADNKKFKTEYDKVKERYDNAAKDSVAYAKWQEIKTKKRQMDSFEDAAQKADAEEKKLIKKQQELQWEVIPDIKGVEIVLEDTHEDSKMIKAGFYYNGLNSRQLSESEWFGLVLQILKKNKVKILVIDNISGLGSKFMDTLQKLVKDGCYVLYTEMERGQTELQIEYN